MSQRSAFAIQILEKIGAPLIGAVSMIAARQGNMDEPKQAAESVAELLNKAVQVSVGLSSAMELRDGDQGEDSTRLALVALAGQLVASQYGVTARVPGDQEVKRLLTGLEAVLTFSDSFAPAAGNTARIEHMDAARVPGDESQISIQYVNALVPVVNAVAAFSYGRPEKKLVQEIAGHLVARAQDMRTRIMPDSTGGPPVMKQGELRLLSALATIYVGCHIEQMNALMTMDEKTRNQLMQDAGGVMPMDAVWQSFEQRAQMAELLGSSAVGSLPAASGSVAPALPRNPPPPPALEKPVPETAPALQSPPENPMAMFAKKPDQPAAPPAASEAPPAPPPSAATKPPAPLSSTEETGPAAENPMSFFRGGGKKDEDEK